jgi:hypothetical protein
MTVVPTLAIVIRVESTLNPTALFGMKVAPVACPHSRYWINIHTAELFATLPAPGATTSRANHKGSIRL